MLLLDDALAFDNSPSARRARPAQLRTIASRTAALVDSLPESPGARRLLAITRARQASLDNRASSWQLALEQAEAAYRLDPHDPELPNLLWTLSLRAGQWEQALHWQALTSPPSLNSSLTCLD